MNNLEQQQRHQRHRRKLIMIKDYEGSLYGDYRQKSFQEVWKDVDSFLSDYQGSQIPVNIKNDSATTLYYLLYGKYGNDIVASSDINRFKYRVYSIIFQYGPTWEKKLELQDKIRQLSDDEIMLGGTTIANTATNPGSKPTTQTTEELKGIGKQNVNKYKKDALSAYKEYYYSIEDDITEKFLDRFNSLFIKIVQPELPLLYEVQE